MTRFDFLIFFFIVLPAALLAAEQIEPLLTVPNTATIRSEIDKVIGQNPQNENTLEHLNANLNAWELQNAAIQLLSENSPPIQDYIATSDAFAWKELPFAQNVVTPKLPVNVLSSDLLSGTLRFYLAHRLAQSRLYEEANRILAENQTGQCIDPAGFWITQAVVCYQLGQAENGQVALKHFQEIADKSAVPHRYSETAKLLENGLAQAKKDNEAEKIANKMKNVQRQLGKGKTGDETQEEENGILKSLDQLIEKIEKAAQQQAGGEPKGGQGNKPADDSRRMGQKAPGNVDRRDLSQDGNWGGISPKERDEALLKIDQEFPPFYRDIIEQYFREIAK
ncbi:hypothetical protein FACS189454_06140 [Planctomycetales bacterium]|nr:hypothetical protein FACS189454_06140 [Planctomycetales bacterium]